MIWMLLIINIGTSGGTSSMQMNDISSCQKAAHGIEKIKGSPNWQIKYICVERATGKTIEVNNE